MEVDFFFLAELNHLGFHQLEQFVSSLRVFSGFHFFRCNPVKFRLSREPFLRSGFAKAADSLALTWSLAAVLRSNPVSTGLYNNT